MKEAILGVQLSAHVLPAVTENSRVQLNGSSILISNPGDEDVTIDNYFTLSAGQSLTLKTGDDLNVLTWSAKISFAGGGVNPRIEIIELRVAEPGYGNYNVQ